MWGSLTWMAEWVQLSKAFAVILFVCKMPSVKRWFFIHHHDSSSLCQQEYWEAGSIAEQVCVFFLFLSRLLVAPVFPSDPRKLHPEILTKLPLQ
jgi:hypothetical protein